MSTAKIGGWESKSTGTKTGIVLSVIAGAILIIVAVKKFVFPTIEPKKNNITPDGIATSTNTATTPEVENVKEQQPHLQPTTADLTLPNKGVGCSETVANYDRDYDYVKCGGVWYTKSKANPSSISAKDKYKDWTSLENNEVATKLLNTRYPAVK